MTTCKHCNMKQQKLTTAQAEVRYYRRQFEYLQHRIERLLQAQNHNGGGRMF